MNNISKHKNNKTKVGVISLFYKNYNFGAVLQSYALCKFINSININCICEQISYIQKKDDNRFISKFVFKTKQCVLYFLYLLKLRNQNPFIHSRNKYINKRKKLIDCFTKDFVPHSSKVYSHTNIDECQKYDILICGSDQVWNNFYSISENEIDKGYWLNYKSNAKKSAYAASPPISGFNKQQQLLILKSLLQFSDISLRETKSIETINELFKENNYDIEKCTWFKRLSVVCDPVLLLDTNVWQNFIEPINETENEFVFTYLLGEENEIRKKVKSFCKNNNYKLINIPYVTNCWRECDNNFADVNIKNASPQKFLSLIKSAKFVFTDSFHASLFSCLFHTKFFICNRKTEITYSCFSVPERIEELCQLVRCDFAFLSDAVIKNNFEEYVISKEFDFEFINKQLIISQEYSRQFLKDAICN